MADEPVDNAVKTGVAVTAGGIAGATILAPVVTAGLVALGVVATGGLALPILGGSVLLGMWGGKKVKDAVTGP